ncbi:MAG: PilN domain-containing protein [Bdellovibrionales bacterium]
MKLNNTVSRFFQTARQESSRALAWWTGEIKGLAPGNFTGLLRRPRPRLVLMPGEKNIGVEIVKDGEAHALAPLEQLPTYTKVNEFETELHHLIGSRTPEVLLGLKDDNLLIVRVDYPLTAEPNLGRIFTNELDRLTPFSTDQVYWDWHVRSRDIKSGRLIVDVAVARRTSIDSLVAAARRYGLSPEAVLYHGDNGAEETVYRLFKQTGFDAGDQHRRSLNRSLNAGIVLLLVLLGGLMMHHAKRTEDMLAERMAAIKPLALQADDARARLKRLNDIADVMQGKTRNSSSLAILAALTNIMPDNAWIYDLQIRGNEIRMSGFAGDPAGLIPLLDASPAFADAKFLSPVTAAPNGTDQRFEISVSALPGTAAP